MPAAAAAPSSTTEKEEKPSRDSGLSLVSMVLAAVGGGIGVLGFVAFFGAAIIWVRMDQAGLPGNEAVALVPNSVLVTTGASFLVPALLIALGFTVLLFLVEQSTYLVSTRSLRKLERKLVKAERTAEREQAIAEEARESAAKALEHKIELKDVAEKTTILDGLFPDELERAKVAANAALSHAQKAESAAQPEARQAEQSLLEVKKETERKRDQQQTSIERHRKALRRVLVGALFAGVAVAAVKIYSIGLPPGRLLALAGLWTGLTLASLLVLARTDSFTWFTITAFAAVAMLIGFITYVRTVDQPKVEPAAVLRTHGVPVFGFFVAQTSDRIYLGTHQGTHGDIRIDSIPRDEVINLTIASMEPPAVANRQARRLALELCRRYRQHPPPVPAAGGEATEATEFICADPEMQHIRRPLLTARAALASGPLRP
jgi:hypothetical protein